MSECVFSNLYNISLFFVMQRELLDISMKSVASDSHMSISKLSRIENNKFTLTNDLIMSLLDIYHVSIEEFKQADKEYEQLYYSILDYICVGVNDNFDLISDLDELDEKYSYIKIPTSLMIRFIVYSTYFSYNLLDRQLICYMDQLYKWILDNLEFFSLTAQKIFYIFCGEMSYFKRDYSMARNNLIKAKNNYQSLGKYDVILYGTLLKVLAKVGNDINYYQYYSNFIDLCVHNGLSNRLISGKINFSSFLRSMNQYSFALKNDLECLNQLLNGNYNINLQNVILFNIGIDYKFLHNYDKASEYIKKTIDYWNDYESYFELSYCLYKCGNIAEAKKIIKQAKMLGEKTNTYLSLINWLQFIIRGLLEKAEDILVNVYNEEYYNSSMITKRTFLLLLTEQYVLMENYRLAYKYSDQLNML